VHELRWKETLDDLVRFRYWIKHKYRVYLEEELHAADLITKPESLPKSLQRLKKHERLAIVRHHADQLARLGNIRLINVYVDKETLGNDEDSNMVFQRAWYALFQRFENTMLRRNFPGPPNEQERGIIFPDNTDAKRLRQHLSDMRLRNTLWIKKSDGYHSRIDEPIRLLIEDPVCRESRESYFIQAADCAIFLFKQHIDPSSFMKKHGGNAYFRTRLKPVLCTQASKSDPFGVVRL